MTVLINLVGNRFGKWTVLGRVFPAGRRSGTWWHCRCDCGGESTVSSANLKGGFSRGCSGCQRTQAGLSTTREYGIWSKMLLRCYREDNDNYRYYGALGVYVCRRWRESFLAFREDMGLAPTDGHTLDRADTLGNYTCGRCDECREKGQPANCRWATKAEQVRNARSNRYYTHDGKTLILKDWARLAGIKYLTLWNRLNCGMAFADAISIPTNDRRSLRRLRGG